MGGVRYGLILKCRDIMVRMGMELQEGQMARFAYSGALCNLVSPLFDMRHVDEE